MSCYTECFENEVTGAQLPPIIQKFNHVYKYICSSSCSSKTSVSPFRTCTVSQVYEWNLGRGQRGASTRSKVQACWCSLFIAIFISFMFSSMVDKTAWLNNVYITWILLDACGGKIHTTWDQVEYQQSIGCITSTTLILRNVYCRPNKIYTNNGKRFVVNFWRTFCNS